MVDKPAARARGGQPRLELAVDLLPNPARPSADGADNGQATTPHPNVLAELLCHVALWPHLQMERQSDGVTLRVRDVVVGMLNFRTRILSVNVPSDLVQLLLAFNPRLVSTKDGVSLCLTDADSATEAEAPLRWRIELERFAHQLRAASP